MKEYKRYQRLELKITPLNVCDVITASPTDGVGIEWDTGKWGGLEQ